MTSPFTISHIQSILLQRLAAAKTPRKTAVPQEYYDALAFHESLKLGEFTFDTTFDRIFKLHDKFVYVLGSSQLQYDEVDDTEYVSLWCYDTRDGKYRRFEQRWKSAEMEDLDDLDIHLCSTTHMTLYKTEMAFDTFQALLESDTKALGPSEATWDSYTCETIAHEG